NAKGATTLSDITYTLDSAGNPTKAVRSGGLAETTTLTYDNLNRITSVCFQLTCPNGTDPFVKWSYDDVGNRLSEQRPSGTKSYTYNNADQLTQAGSTAYTYDQNGNEKTAGSTTFSYDLANRLVSTTSGSTTTTYTYDGLDKRLQASTVGRGGDRARPRRARLLPALPARAPQADQKHQPARADLRRGQATDEGDRPLPRRDLGARPRVGRARALLA